MAGRGKRHRAEDSGSSQQQNTEDHLNALRRDAQQQLRKFLKDADVILVCGEDNQEVKIHSSTLRWWSEVLGGMLDDLDVICSPKQPVRLPLPEDAAADWAQLQEFMYPCRPQATITHSNLKAVLALGNKYSMDSLLKECDKYFAGDFLKVSPILPGYVFKWLVFADQLRLEQIVLRCLQFIHCYNYHEQSWFDAAAGPEQSLATTSLGRVDMAALRPETLARLVKIGLFRDSYMCTHCGKFAKPNSNTGPHLLFGQGGGSGGLSKSSGGIPAQVRYQQGYQCHSCQTKHSKAM